MAQEISHDGIVESADGSTVRVRIVQQSACSGCHARSMCQASEMMVKQIDAETTEPLKVGERVVVSVEQHLGWKAVAYAFVIPMAVMMALLVAGQQWWPEPAWLAGVAAIGALVPYYIVLHRFEGRFKRQYRFVARKKQS